MKNGVQLHYKLSISKYVYKYNTMFLKIYQYGI
jgi:hypothetical protein